MTWVWENKGIRGTHIACNKREMLKQGESDSERGKEERRAARCERAKMKRVETLLHKLDLISCATNLAI